MFGLQLDCTRVTSTLLNHSCHLLVNFDELFFALLDGLRVSFDGLQRSCSATDAHGHGILSEEACSQLIEAGSNDMQEDGTREWSNTVVMNSVPDPPVPSPSPCPLQNPLPAVHLPRLRDGSRRRIARTTVCYRVLKMLVKTTTIPSSMPRRLNKAPERSAPQLSF